LSQIRLVAVVIAAYVGGVALLVVGLPSHHSKTGNGSHTLALVPVPARHMRLGVATDRKTSRASIRMSVQPIAGWLSGRRSGGNDGPEYTVVVSVPAWQGEPACLCLARAPPTDLL
jgi:hypothetical protein